MSDRISSSASLGVRTLTVLLRRTSRLNIASVSKRPFCIMSDVRDVLEHYTVPEWAEPLQNKPTHRVKVLMRAEVSL